ncbi:hypothetical protein E2C01_033198 [Portunus trituberculatus]|uniref:Uncharacterized protein n=1 Tax=Portunus trituberculatus TaxID=210409 RepID=A0A5B7F3K6_PORTR|nr:hypothetical protein [Portunus trituberculatus]
MEDGDRRTRGRSKIMKSQCLRNIKKFNFPYRMVDIWSRLSEETVTAESVHKFKEKLYVVGFEPTRRRLSDPTLTTLSTMPPPP